MKLVSAVLSLCLALAAALTLAPQTSDRVEERSEFGERNSQPHPGDEMTDASGKFDINAYRNLLETLHDARQDLTEASVQAGNDAMDALGDYLEANPPQESDFTLIKGLLSHPKRTVRAMAGMELLDNNHLEGWPAILEAATPVYCPYDEPPGEAWRDYCAAVITRINLMLSLAVRSEEMGLRPTLTETEDRWIAEGLTDRRILRIPLTPE